jgi:hypothetical protein
VDEDHVVESPSHYQGHRKNRQVVATKAREEGLLGVIGGKKGIVG